MIFHHVKHVGRKFFVPHEGNGYRPHILHPKRTIGYAIFFTAMKLFVAAVVVAVPSSIFASPEASSALMSQLIAQTNGFRQSERVSVLNADARLARSASAKATDMSAHNYFAHWSPDGSGPERFISDAGYPYAVAGENLAMGYANAPEIISAWVSSPTHRRNLVDTNFVDVGFGVLSGMFQDTPTLFVVQHLGKIITASPLPVVQSVAPVVRVPVSSPQPKAAALIIDQERTNVAWQEDDGGTKLTATVRVEGVVREASVEVRGYDIQLAPKPEDPAVLTGSTTIPLAPDELFRVVTPATLTVVAETADETLVSAPISWNAPLRRSMTLMERYTTARTLLPKTLGPILHTSRAVTLAAFVIFALAWIVNLFIEIRRQHIDLVVPGGALVLLLGFLSFV
ncbi:MAG: CAP domain-containing protein [bacterium]|nr:CAP domain-containing protein [bacterium]